MGLRLEFTRIYWKTQNIRGQTFFSKSADGGFANWQSEKINITAKVFSLLFVQKINVLITWFQIKLTKFWLIEAYLRNRTLEKSTDQKKQTYLIYRTA